MSQIPDYLKQEQDKVSRPLDGLDFLEVKEGSVEVKLLPLPGRDNPFVSLYFWSDWNSKLFTQAYEMNWGTGSYKDPVQAVVQLLQTYGLPTIKPRLYAYFNVLDMRDGKVKVVRLSRYSYEKIIKLQSKRVERGLPLLEAPASLTLEFEIEKLPSGIETIDVIGGREVTIDLEQYRTQLIPLHTKLQPNYNLEKLDKLVTDAYTYATNVINSSPNKTNAQEVMNLIKNTLKQILEYNKNYYNSRVASGLPKTADQLLGGTAPSITTPTTPVEDIVTENVDFDTLTGPATVTPASQPVSVPPAGSNLQTPFNTSIPKTVTSVPNSGTGQAAPSTPSQAAPNIGGAKPSFKLPGSPDCFGVKVPLAGLDCNTCAFKIVCYTL